MAGNAAESNISENCSLTPVLRHFINPKRLESLGFSMYHPVAPNDSDENKQRNRRVEIVLKPAAEPEPAKDAAPAAAPEAKP
jgi:hypothetical protein